MRRQHGDRALAALQRADLPLVQRHRVAPILDRTDRRYLVGEAQQRRQGIALAGGERILKDDDRQIAGLRDRLEMGQRHLFALAEGEGAGREDQQRRGAALARHGGDARRLGAAIGIDAVHQRHAVADRIHRHRQDAALLRDAARGDLGRMGVDGDGGDARRRGELAEMAAETGLVDGEIAGERQEGGGDHPVRNEIAETRHLASLLHQSLPA